MAASLSALHYNAPWVKQALGAIKAN